MLSSRLNGGEIFIRAARVVKSSYARLDWGILSCKKTPLQWQQGSLRRVTFVRKPAPKEGKDALRAKTTSSISHSAFTWKRIAWYVKVSRIPFLLVALYTLGYQQGVVDTVRNPLKIQQGYFEEICQEMSVTSGEDVDIISQKSKPPNLGRLGWYALEAEKNAHDPRTERVAKIGRNIIRAAGAYVREKLKAAAEEASKKYKDKPMTDLELVRLLHKDADFKFWAEALERVEGFSVDGLENWQFILLGTPIPNAFVAEILPQRFFVTTGMFDEYIENDDELAMILGHEISHLVMGHVTKGTWIEFCFRGLEITFLMLDPTEGMLSLAVATFLASTRTALVAAHSRSNETEADELGCKLAAMACYDTRKGGQVFLKMYEFEEKMGHSGKDMMSTHPPTKERFDKLKLLSKDENLEKYSHCHTLGLRIKKALTLGSKNEDQ